MILETENLANADLKGLERSMAAIAKQDPSPEEANEVLLIESGDVPDEVLAALQARYPWITVHRAPAGTGYYDAKMLGAQLATGEVVVYCDSDCLYGPGWLHNLIGPFIRQEIDVVAGETMTRGRGPYGTAMAMTYIFPQYSGEVGMAPAPQYYLNNVAFRREFLLRNPMPTALPLYRGHCVFHARQLTQAGHTIWRQPQARATHAPPNGVSHFFWRFLLIGHDLYWQKRMLQDAKAQGYLEPVSGAQGGIAVFRDRLRKMLRHKRRHLLYLPLAVPIVAVSVLLICVGYWITRLAPHGLLKTYEQILGEA